MPENTRDNTKEIIKLLQRTLKETKKKGRKAHSLLLVIGYDSENRGEGNGTVIAVTGFASDLTLTLSMGMAHSPKIIPVVTDALGALAHAGSTLAEDESEGSLEKIKKLMKLIKGLGQNE